MNGMEITMVRLYLHEGETQLETLLKRLRDWEKLRGLTVFRGIAGFGDSGKIHEAKWTDLAMDLPIVVEFFDSPDKVSAILGHLEGLVKPEHMVWWQAQTNSN
jgi:PII-like signaling protein